MARMIPGHATRPHRTPMSEWEVITGLQGDDSASKTWTVMHSLDIRRHVNKLEGEADLLVLAPGLGVMVVEVKGCNVSRKGGKWTYHYAQPKTSIEGPFKQARSAMHSIRKWLEDKGRTGDWLEKTGLENWKKWAWHSCVVFTSLERFGENPSNTTDGPEWESSEVVTRSDIQSHGIAEALARALKARRAELARKKHDGVEGAAWYDDEKSRPTAVEIEALVNTLRPDFHYDGEALANIQRLEKAVHDATEEQAGIAANLLENQRLVLKGAAGTGKTYVAIRLARYFAEPGLRVGLLCFNKFLGAWLKSELADVVGNKGYVGTFSRLMLDITGEPVPQGSNQEFWDRELPERAQTCLLGRDAEPRFDILIVDEAQDLLQDAKVDVLDLLLKDGLKDGRWIFAGDFSGQAIYSSGANAEQLLARLARKGIAQATFTLDVNCRNALRVTENIHILTTPQISYRSCLRSEVEGEFKPHFVKGGDTAKRDKLRELLTLLRKRFSPEQIVALSRLAKNSTASLLAASEPDLRLQELKGPTPDKGTSGYTTIHAFKGLDAAAIIVTDIADLDDALFYTGISRGRQEVHLLLEEGMKQAYAARVVR